MKNQSSPLPKTFVVLVENEACGRSRAKRYMVRATTAHDAQQLAFALDGGWGLERDARHMLPLAQSHASIVAESET